MTILRHGKPAAVLVSWDEWERRRRAEAAAGSAGNALAAITRRLGETGQTLYEAGMDAYERRHEGPLQRPLPEIDD